MTAERSTGGVANELWVAPETSASTDPGLRRLVSDSLERTSLLVATTVPSPEEWMERWCRAAEERPANLGVVHVGGQTRSTTVRRDLTRVGEGVPVFTTAPADDVTELLQTLTDLLVQVTDAPGRTVVYVPALATLVERAGLETVFRHLHIFTHRLRAAGATGYFQADASLHGSGAVDVLRPLFDRTVRVPGGGADGAHGEASNRRGVVRATADERSGAPSTDANGPSGVRSATDGGVVTARAGTGAAPTPSASASGAEATGERETASLSNAECVRHLLRTQGGRVRQQDVIRHTGWSASKVCRTVSKLADEGRVEKVSVGRENVVVLLDGV